MCSPGLSSVDRLAEAVAGLRGDNLALLTAQELEARVRDLRRLADQVEAVFAQTTAAFEDSEAYKEVGARTGASWLRHQLRMSPGEARRRIRVGQQLKDLLSLCPRHHRNVHSGRLRIQTTGGQFRFFTRQGQQLHDHRPQSRRIVTDLTQQLLDLT